MKTNLAKTLFAVPFLGLMAASQSHAETKIVCSDEHWGKIFWVFRHENADIGDALVDLESGDGHGTSQLTCFQKETNAQFAVIYEGKPSLSDHDRRNAP